MSNASSAKVLRFASSWEPVESYFYVKSAFRKISEAYIQPSQLRRWRTTVLFWWTTICNSLIQASWTPAFFSYFLCMVPIPPISGLNHHLAPLGCCRSRLATVPSQSRPHATAAPGTKMLLNTCILSRCSNPSRSLASFHLNPRPWPARPSGLLQAIPLHGLPCCALERASAFCTPCTYLVIPWLMNLPSHTMA